MKQQSIWFVARMVFIVAMLGSVSGCATDEGEKVEDPLKNDLTGPQSMGPYWRPF